MTIRNLANMAVLAVSLCVTSATFVGHAEAQSPESTGFSNFILSLRAQALSQGVKASTFDSVAPTVSLDERAIRLDRQQPGGNPATQSPTIPAFAPYRIRHVNAELISLGRQNYTNLRPLVQRIENETGVPEEIMLAIYGHETGYGRVTGNFDLLNALGTLAYEGRRRSLFTDEFIATLRLIDQGFARSKLKGSWAGATGYPQFLPSVYLRLARDGDADGKADIWSSEADALASIANYLLNAGWKANVPWGVAAMVPATLDTELLAPKMTSYRCARVHDRHRQWKTIAEWKKLGVQIIGSRPPSDGELASLLEPDGPGKTAYLLTGNYRAILDYNCSNFYALSVGLLANEIAR